MYNQFGSHTPGGGRYKFRGWPSRYKAVYKSPMEENFYIEPASDDPDEHRSILANARECFTIRAEFMERMGFDLPEPTAEDKNEAMQIYTSAPNAPTKPTTLGAAIVLEKMLAKHDYVLADPSNKMRNYVVFKLFEHAENEDPKVSLKALEYLAKSSEVGLFSDKIEVNINQKTTVELESELSSLLKSIANRGALPDSSSALDAEFTSI